MKLVQKSAFLVVLLCFPLLALAIEETQAEETTSSTTSTTTSSTTTISDAIIVDPKLNVTKDLFASETADPKKVDIVKQIRRLNEDGSYTVGYEAGDGTFKIESRDVQGNIKGTFGYVDEDGEIKRVSYSTVNNSSQPPSLIPFLQSNRINRTSTTTTRKPLPTIIYPKNGPTRPTVIQSIPRRRIITTTTTTPTISSTESYSTVTGNVINVNTSEVPTTSEIIRTVSRFPVFTPRAENNKPVYIPQGNAPINEPKIYKPVSQIRSDPSEVSDTASTSAPSYVRPNVGIFEKTVEKQREKIIRPNTFRRQLNPTTYENDQMAHFHQTIGEDTTDVYGGSLLVGTSRPLFTTTTLRSRPPIHSILSRQRLPEKLTTSSPQVHEDQQESTLEASTNKITDESYVTSNPIPIVQIPVTTPDAIHQRVIERPFLRRHPSNTAQFKTREFLRDNPGAAIPIGNQRVLFRYNPNIQVDENGDYARPIISAPNANLIPVPQNIGQDAKGNIIAIPVNPNNIPQQRFQVYYPQERPAVIPQRIPLQPSPALLDTNDIQAPVSTRDLKKLLQLLLIRQNRFQTLMDIRDDINPVPYAPQPAYEPEFRTKSAYGPRSVYPSQYNEQQRYNEYTRQVPYPYQPPYEPTQYPRSDYRSQDDGYRNEISNFNPAIPYESQRYVPRRRYFRPRTYDARYEGMQETPEPEDYLPSDVRESLLLKMLMLAINPDFTSGSPEPQIMMTTQTPEFRKKVRNVQILGEVSEAKEEDPKRKSRAMM